MRPGQDSHGPGGELLAAEQDVSGMGFFSPSRWAAAGDLRAVALGAAVPALWLAAIPVAVNAALYYVLGHGVGMDSHAYWLAGREQHPYGRAPEQGDAFLYSPLFAQLMRLLAHLPWPVFCGAWMVLIAAAYLWLTRPLGWRWRIPVLLLCLPELLIGNIYSFMAISLVMVERRPVSLAFLALTKVTPAGVGILWLAMRGRWRDLTVAVGGTWVLVLCSFVVNPSLWQQWVAFLAAHSGQGGFEFPLRLLAAIVVVVLSARCGRRWPLALAFYLAVPLAGLSIQTMTTLVAGIRLAVADGRDPL